MKTITLITAAAIVNLAYAGEPAPMAPAPATSCWDGWFVGGTYGQFESDFLGGGETYPGDLEFDMYTLHVGRDLDKQVLGCDLSAYLEFAALLGEFEGYTSVRATIPKISIDVDIYAFTANLKAEREFFAGIKGYISGGIGYAFTRLSGDDDESYGDGGFYAQAAIGLSYDINQNWEIYGGGRWLYLESLEFGYPTIEVDNGTAWEIGLRYNF